MYDVLISGPRRKVSLIKLLRAVINNFGLGDAKFYVESEFYFDDWMPDAVTFTLRVTASQYGRLAHHVMDDTRFDIISSTVVPDSPHRILDVSNK